MPKPKQHGNLKDIKIDEVSMVDLPANKIPFLFFKRDGAGKTQLTKAKKKITIEIESDGTVNGTKITINGDKLGKLKSFEFGFYNDDPKATIHASYTKTTESVDGFSRTETYYLTKGVLMTKEMLKTLKEYFGTDDVDFEKKVDEDTVENALALIAKEYKASFPQDLVKAVGIIAKCAAGSFDKEEDVEKAGAKFSKDVVKKLQAVIAAVEAMKAIMSTTEPTQKAADGESKEMVELTKQLTELKQVIAGSGSEKKNEDKSEIAKLTEVVEKVVSRVETMEKVTDKRKGIVDQDDDDDDDDDDKGKQLGKGAGEKGKTLWPSITQV